MRKFVSSSPEETIRWASELYPLLGDERILCFFGDLASGKTTFIKGLAKSAGIPETQVSSPTFVYLNIYAAKQPIYHFDLYRLKDVDQFLSMGFEEYLFGPGLKCVEWSERIATLIPQEALQITFSTLSENEREIHVKGI